MTSDTGKPSSAYRMAGSSSRDRGMLPHSARSVSQPCTVPGTHTEYGPAPGMER